MYPAKVIRDPVCAWRGVCGVPPLSFPPTGTFGGYLPLRFASGTRPQIPQNGIYPYGMLTHSGTMSRGKTRRWEFPDKPLCSTPALAKFVVVTFVLKKKSDPLPSRFLVSDSVRQAEKAFSFLQAGDSTLYPGAFYGPTLPERIFNQRKGLTRRKIVLVGQCPQITVQTW
jgi:hypothetical protein